MDEYVSLPLSAMWEQRPAPIFEVPKLFLGFPGDTWWHDSSQTYQAAHSPDASPSSDSLWDLHCGPTPRKSLVPGRAPVSRRRTYTAPPSPGRGRWCPWPDPAVLVTEGSSLESTVSWTCAPHLRVLSADAGWTHRLSRPRAETPVSFLGQGCLALSHSSRVLGETLLSIFTPKSGIGLRDDCKVRWEGWVNQKFWVRKNASQLHVSTESLANNASRPSGYHGPLRWTHFRPRLGWLLAEDKA